MAEVFAPFIINRTMYSLTFYCMAGRNFVRTKSSLSRKRVLRSPEFERTRYYAGLMAKASKIGSFVYNALPGYWRQGWMYRSFTGEVANPSQVITAFFRKFPIAYILRELNDWLEAGISYQGTYPDTMSELQTFHTYRTVLCLVKSVYQLIQVRAWGSQANSIRKLQLEGSIYYFTR